MKTVMDGTAGRQRPARRPVIGICGRTAQVNWLGFDLPVTLLPQMYVDLLDGVGCTPVLLPLQPEIGHVIGRLDGLLLPGGGDVDPARYGASPHAMTNGVSADVDQAEMALLEQALAAGLPFFGICRGLQVLNVLRGGTLCQYLPDITQNGGHQPEPGTYATQTLTLRPDSHIARIYGGSTAEVPCYHHQAVDQLGTGLAATAWAQDGVVEAVEATDHPFALGVQWHADQIGDERPFRAFAEAVRCAAEQAPPRAAAPQGGP